MADLTDGSATIRTVIALAAAIAATPLVARAEEPAPPAPVRAPDHEARPLVLDPGRVRGKVVDLDGKTPLKGARVHLESLEGKALADASTDASGRFDLAAQAAGQYRLRIGNALAKLVLKDGANARELLIALAKDVALPAKPAAGAPEGAAGGGAAGMSAEAEAANEPVSVLGIEVSDWAVAVGVGVGAIAVGGGIAAGVATSGGGGGAAPSPSK